MVDRTEDHDCLQLCLETLLNDRERREQMKVKLAHEEPEAVAHFACYVLQSKNLHLMPWQSPPVWIDDPDAVGKDDVNYNAALLTKKMLAKGISRFHPDPLAPLKR
ncbi:hypothetical protein [Bradyrhizobium sp. Arg816]|uniref:hypothetical protein n=1 Tax=Bradyrhizobium sp. Arg816 TaxID=2998491 RepID=UPI00249F1932|nr:hypothetical protein [Bradyrhizobium sp. Arg816]MDI3562537.1 hypothetical protein [Bradyrhizobium sp. Arg816]